MALEILAKYPVLRNGEPQKLFCRAALWVDGVGLVGTWYTGANGSWYTGAIQLDGTMSYIDRKPSIFSSAGVSHGQDLISGKVMVMYHYGYGWARLAEAKTSIWEDDLVFAGSPAFYPQANGKQIRLTDRWLKAVNSTVSSAPLSNLGPWTVEYSIPQSPAGLPKVSDAGDGKVWFLYPNGDIVLYDYIQKVVAKPKGKIWPFSGNDAFRGAWWSRDLGVFIALTSDSSDNNRHYLWVFANETRPFSLSNPVALTTLQKGDVTTMEVTLTGEQGEPAEGFNVEWSITAGTGALSVSQSVTDENGKATTDYSAPPNSPTTFDLQAQVSY